MQPGYAYVWKYQVRPDSVAEFEAIYGPGGAWERLLRGHQGYLSTQLLRGLEDDCRYLTIDYWTSEAAFRACREQPEFVALDARCERLTTIEVSLGSFRPVG